MGNFNHLMPVVKSALFTEDGVSTAYTFDVFVPAGAIILDVGVSALALWDDGTAAAMEVGIYADSDGAVGAAVDADGIFTAVDLKATDLVANESINMSSLNGGVLGVYINADSAEQRVSTSDRWVRFSVAATDGDGTAGRTYVWCEIAQPVVDAAEAS